MAAVVPFEIEFVEGEPPKFNFKKWLKLGGFVCVASVAALLLGYLFVAWIIFIVEKPTVKTDLKTVSFVNSSDFHSSVKNFTVRTGIEVAFVMPPKLKLVPNEATFTLVAQNSNETRTAISNFEYTISKEKQVMQLEFQLHDMGKLDKVVWFKLSGGYSMTEKLAAFQLFPYCHEKPRFECSFAVLVTEPDSIYSKTCSTIKEEDQAITWE